jgi:hypothetical protein
MRKNVLFILILLLALAGMAHAQERTQPPTREIYTVLAYGDEAFEPDLWYSSAAEEAVRTTATWTPRPESGYGSALAYADYLHFGGGYTMDGLRELFDASWFIVTFANYESYTATIDCEQDDTLLFEFALRSDGEDYLMRYWVEPATDDRVMALFIVFPGNDVDARRLLEDHARRLYPDFPACPR